MNLKKKKRYREKKIFTIIEKKKSRESSPSNRVE